jgi:hypothetical protein
MRWNKPDDSRSHKVDGGSNRVPAQSTRGAKQSIEIDDSQKV